MRLEMNEAIGLRPPGPQPVGDIGDHGGVDVPRHLVVRRGATWLYSRGSSQYDAGQPKSRPAAGVAGDKPTLSTRAACRVID